MADNPYVNKVEYGGNTIIDISDTTAIPSDVASGKYFYGADGEKKLGTATGGGGGGAIVIEDTSDPAGGTVRTITAVDLSADTVAADKLLSGYTAHNSQGTPITGTYVPSAGIDLPTFTATMDGGGNITITCDKTYAECVALANDDINAALLDAGRLLGMHLTVWGADYITYEETNIDSGISISTIAITYHSDNTITFTDDNINSRDSTSLLVSGATVTAEAGWYETNVSKSVASGTEGTPTASKGAVSNHSVAVTPSVTNTAGYINGGTKTGTPVTVTAAELVSGSETKTQNGTFDVTNLASLVVDVPPVGYDVPTFIGTLGGGGMVFTCDKSFAEAKALADYGLTAALVIITSLGASAYNVIEKDASHITYRYIDPWEIFRLTYYSNGTIEWDSDVVPTRGSEHLTVSGATVTAPAGMYESAASATVASGTEGTPTASKGAVNNHAVTVTPTVTNTAGYINGSTKTGTGVQVTAAELVSGSETKTQNGTYDVTNLQTLVVNVPAGKNAQIANGFNRVAATAYTAVTGQSITVSKSGTYDVYWVGYRSSTSGTNGSQLYIGNTAYGTASTSFDATYTNWQMVHLSGVSLTENQTITVRARSRGTSYYMYIANLTIIES